jgi:predicted transcriptional regulator
MKEDFWADLGFVIAGLSRRGIILALKKGPATPKILSRICEMPLNHVSNSLKQLSDRKLVECLNEEVRKGRLYSLTERGHQISELITENLSNKL